MNANAVLQHLDGLFRDGKISDVEPYLLQQLVVANQEHDKDTSLVIMNEMIGFYRSQQRFDEALRVTRQALDMCARETPGSIAHATTLVNGATAHRFAGQPEKALELFAKAEAIYQEKLSPMDEHFAGLLNNMSAAYSDLGQLDKAGEYLLRAAAIMDALPDRVVESAVTHANLAALYFKMKNGSGAKREIATACDRLRNRPENAEQYEQFCAMQKLFDALPD